MVTRATNIRWQVLSSNSHYLLIFALLISQSALAQANLFPIVTKANKVSIVYDNKAPKLDSISAHLLAADIERVTSFKPKVITDITRAAGNITVIGAIQSPVMQKLVGAKSTFF